MSIEAHLQALTVAVTALTNRIDTLIGADKGTPVPGTVGTDAQVENTGATQATAPKASATKPTPPKAKPETKGGDNVIDYDAVKNAVIKLASSKGRDAAVGVLSTFGVDNAQKLKPEQYAGALEALQLAAA